MAVTFGYIALLICGKKPSKGEHGGFFLCKETAVKYEFFYPKIEKNPQKHEEKYTFCKDLAQKRKEKGVSPSSSHNDDLVLHSRWITVATPRS